MGGIDNSGADARWAVALGRGRSSVSLASELHSYLNLRMLLSPPTNSLEIPLKFEVEKS